MAESSHGYTGTDFCDMVLSGRIDVEKVHETAGVLAYRHTRPFWPVHIVVIPKGHIPSLLALQAEHADLMMEMASVLQIVARGVIEEHGAAAVLTNLGSYQDTKHLHWHVHYGPPLR